MLGINGVIGDNKGMDIFENMLANKENSYN